MAESLRQNVALVYLVALVAAALAAFAVLGGCDGGGGQAGFATGGKIFVSTSSVPSLDPALATAADDTDPLSLVYTPLLTYRHVEGQAGTELIPGLAANLPEISDRGRRYELRLRDGLSYSDGSEVAPDDFEHAVKRALFLGSPDAGELERITGARAYARSREPHAEIAGIEANEETREITIRIDEPYAAFANVLARVATAPVARDTPFEDLSEEPPAGVGAYRIAHSAARSFVLSKHPAFGDLDIPDIPTGNVERITVAAGDSPRRQVADVLDGKLDHMQDPPPDGLLEGVLDESPDRYADFPTGSTAFVFFDQAVAPFDDPKVREAVGYGLDKPALATLFGRKLVGGCSLIPRVTPGYDERHDTTECPYGDPTEPPDLTRARHLIGEARAANAKVTVWSSDERRAAAVSKAYAGMLNAVGLDAQARIVDDARYRRLLEPGGVEPQTGFMSWSQPLPHPLEAFDLLDGARRVREGDASPAAVRDPRIAGVVERLNLETDLDSVEAEWAALDRYATSPPQSYVVPFGHPVHGTLFSERIDVESVLFHPVFGYDYSRVALKEGEQ